MQPCMYFTYSLLSGCYMQAEAGSSGSGPRRMGGQSSGAEQFVMKIPNNKVIILTVVMGCVAIYLPVCM